MIQGRHVKMIIHADGTCSIDAVNFADATCTLATGQVMQALGGPVSEERFRPEADRPPPQANRQMESAR